MNSLAYGQNGQTITFLVPSFSIDSDLLNYVFTNKNNEELGAGDIDLSTETPINTVSTAGGKGTSTPDQLTLASVTDLTPGDFYLVANSREEVIEIISISGNVATLSAPVPYAVPAGSELRKASVEIPVPYAVVQEDLIDFYLTVSCVSGGKSLSERIEGYVTKNPMQCPASVGDFFSMFPQFRGMIQNERTLRLKIENAWTSIKTRLHTSERKVEQLLNGKQTLKDLVCWEVLSLLWIGGVRPAQNDNLYDLIDSRLKSTWNSLLNQPQYWDTNSDYKRNEARSTARRIVW